MTPERLIEIRKQELGMTQKELAEATGCGLRTLITYEQGKTDIPKLVQNALMAVRAKLPIQ